MTVREMKGSRFKLKSVHLFISNVQYYLTYFSFFQAEMTPRNISISGWCPHGNKLQDTVYDNIIGLTVCCAVQLNFETLSVLWRHARMS